MTHFHLTLVSNNAKTGKIPVSTSSADTCPKTCGQFETCYAKTGPLALHWNKITAGTRGTNLREFTAAIKALPAGQLWRHNQAGDLPGADETIDAGQLASWSRRTPAKMVLRIHIRK